MIDAYTKSLKSVKRSKRFKQSAVLFWRMLSLTTWFEKCDRKVLTSDSLLQRHSPLIGRGLSLTVGKEENVSVTD